MRVEKIRDATLYLADCREVVPDLEKANCCITDPPYLLTSGGKNTSGPNGGWMSEYNNQGSPVICDIGWPEIMRILFSSMGDGHCYAMANNRNVQAMLTAADAAGFSFHNLLVWDKITATANRWYMKNCEFIGFFYKGRAQALNDCSHKQLMRCPQIDESKHPTEKPVPLMAHYVRNSTQPGGLVLDPFMGTGTTGVAALKLGRRFIGIELDEGHFETACKRIRDAEQQYELV